MMAGRNTFTIGALLCIVVMLARAELWVGIWPFACGIGLQVYGFATHWRRTFSETEVDE